MPETSYDDGVAFEEWLRGLAVYAAANPGQRYGQAAFNWLHMVRPTIANKIRATRFDPFYWSDEERLNAFFDRVQELWEN